MRELVRQDPLIVAVAGEEARTQAGNRLMLAEALRRELGHAVLLVRKRVRPKHVAEEAEDLRQAGEIDASLRRIVGKHIEAKRDARAGNLDGVVEFDVRADRDRDYVRIN